MYYIQDTRQVVGNCALFWRVEGAGYTCDLNEAGTWEEKEALAIARSRSTDKAIRVDLARRLAVTHVSVETLRDALASGADIERCKP